MSPRTPARASCTPRQATAPRTSKSGTTNERSAPNARIDTKIPFTVDADGFFTKEAPGFEGKRVVDDKGKFGDANEAVIEALIEANALLARARYKHDYPHSWRSKKPVIFRATPQWFIAMDKRNRCGCASDTLRAPRAHGHRRDALGAAARREPHHAA